MGHLYSIFICIPGPSFEGVREGRTTPPPPPPVTTKLKIYPRFILQNPPYCTNLQLKIKKIPRGACPLTRVSHSLSAKYHYSSGILQGVQLTYFGSNPKFDPPPSKISGHGPVYSIKFFEYSCLFSIQYEYKFSYCIHILF